MENHVVSPKIKPNAGDGDSRSNQYKKPPGHLNLVSSHILRIFKVSGWLLFILRMEELLQQLIDGKHPIIFPLLRCFILTNSSQLMQDGLSIRSMSGFRAPPKLWPRKWRLKSSTGISVTRRMPLAAHCFGEHSLERTSCWIWIIYGLLFVVIRVKFRNIPI